MQQKQIAKIPSQKNKTLENKEKKLARFIELKDNLSKLESVTGGELHKSITKSSAKESVPKKVKFNEILHLKYVTSCENSYKPVGNTQLNLSFDDL